MDDSQIFITGANGQLGTALRQKYPGAKSADISELDITNKESVLNYDWSNIKVILNAAAYTNVDGAETIEGRVAAWKVNATAVSYLSKVARKYNITVVHISTDFVFDGTTDSHSEEESLSPLSVYGESKAAGDLVVSQIDSHYILRTSWVIGEGKNFVRTMLDLGKKLDNISVINDHIGRPTFTTELVKAIDHLLTVKPPYGIYNISNTGDPVSWAGLTKEIFEIANLECKLTNITNEEYYSTKAGSAPRPLRSSLALDKITATGYRGTDWKTDLKKYIEKENS